MTDIAILQTYQNKAETELRQNILPFWMTHAVDRARGGFYGEISNDLVVDKDAPRGALLTSRILWTYSAAYRLYPDPAYLEMARWAYTDLLSRFWDVEHDGLYWMVAANGTPLRAHKQIYGQAFGIYALSEYYRITGDQVALDKAITLFHRIEAHSYDPQHQGYFEACGRAWEPATDWRLSAKDMNEAKSQNTHLHVMEAYTNLLRVWPDAELLRAQEALLDVMLTRILNPANLHLQLFFDAAWTPKGDAISYGHDIEAAWLLTEAAEVFGDVDLLARVKPLAVKMAQVVHDEALDADGGLLYEADAAGFTNTDKEWWPQAEAAVGFLNAYQLSGQPHFLAAAFRVWDFIETYLVDHVHGEWFRYVTREHRLGTHDAAKVSFWKCPYHNGRACIELVARLKTLQNSSTD
ncbi:MAG TPA: AGE family epimerase/isomerase [Anaerolineae bacterium]|nr:AGE family epimerase/isomerase [Anaerolineae bacterium]